MASRLLVIMGSGETTPTMVKVHRQMFDRVGGQPGPAVLLATPYGFQTNAADISARAVSYFKQSVGQDVEVVALPRTEGAPAQEVEAALGEVAAARWLFSGPGSPTYALRQWRPTVLPRLLAEKLSYGGCTTFSSAAALTLGRWTVPVYEIYKSGGDVVWAEGLDVLGQFGLSVAVIAHFDNSEGGNHDTRYCYLGEPRLRALEAQLHEEGWVLGVDEHTAAIFDFGTGTLEVVGLGAVTVRAQGQAERLGGGATVPLRELPAMARALRDRAGRPPAGSPCQGQRDAEPGVTSRPGGGAVGRGKVLAPPGPGEDKGPLLAEVRRLSAAFDEALGQRDASAAMAAVFELEDVLHAWSADTFESDHVDRARAELRRMLARLGQLAADGLREPRSLAAPWVGALLVERAEARSSRRYADSDRIRQALVDLGVEVQDTPEGSSWELRPPEK
jgi:cyanophycinase-like exopeptidase